MTQCQGMGSKPNVLILGVEHPRDAAAIRSLARHGIAVDIADDKQPPTAMWRTSRYICNKYLLPEDGESAVAMLEGLGLPKNTVLIPTNDQYLILSSKHRERLAHHYQVATLDWQILEPLMDKILCTRLAREVGIETPEHFHPTSLENLDEVIGGLDFNQRAHVLKIRMWDSGAADPKNLRRVVKGGADARSLKEGCLEIFSRTGAFPVIEEVIGGEASRCIGVSLVVDRSQEAVLAYCVRRLKLHTYSKGFFRHPYELGANAYCESVYDEEAIRLAKAFVKHACFSGVITVEFKRCPIDNQLKFIKADPRLVRATRLSTVLGMDIPVALYEVFSSKSKPQKPPANYREGLGWIWFEAYMYSLWKNRRDTSILGEIYRLIRRLPRIRACAYFDIRDLRPSLILMFTAISRLKRLETRGITGKERPVSG
ncbi:hypothetical protein N9H39_03980 [Gammaproteobacteria bacterium]|nr:hypothetical protein [Gammaproteobacteria bacterium]